MTPEEARRKGYGVQLVKAVEPPPPQPPPPPQVNVTVADEAVSKLIDRLEARNINIAAPDLAPVVEAIRGIQFRPGQIVDTCDVEHAWERGFPVLTKVKFNYRDRE